MAVLAKPEAEACLELGALAWDDWTSVDGGVFVATFYTYDAQGNQFWLIGNSHVSGDSVQLQFYATDGAVYGPGFDPATVNRYPWGTASFTFGGCWSAIVDLVPNQDYAAEFAPMSITLTRLTTPASCP